MKLEFGLMSGGGLCGLIIHYCYSYYLLVFFITPLVVAPPHPTNQSSH
jgi:hypothetical protein